MTGSPTGAAGAPTRPATDEGAAVGVPAAGPARPAHRARRGHDARPGAPRPRLRAGGGGRAHPQHPGARHAWSGSVLGRDAAATFSALVERQHVDPSVRVRRARRAAGAGRGPRTRPAGSWRRPSSTLGTFFVAGLQGPARRGGSPPAGHHARRRAARPGRRLRREGLRARRRRLRPRVRSTASRWAARWPPRCFRRRTPRRSATPGWQLRTDLTQLLGEHVALVVAAMRAATGSNVSRLPALGIALNHNTDGAGRCARHPLRARRRHTGSSRCGPTTSTPCSTHRGDGPAATPPP